jgi:1,2-diacylglycerol 3-beta-galactosyltransferase
MHHAERGSENNWHMTEQNNNVKRILILTADAGFGHRSAANAVATALQNTRGDTCAVEIVNPLESKRVPAFLRDSQADYDRIVREMPNLYEFGYQASDAAVPTTVVESALTVVLFDAMRSIVRRHQPDAIVTTYPLYQAPLGAVYAIRRRYIPLLTVITDLVTVHRLWFNEAADLCLVPTQSVRDLALKYGLAADKIRVTGIPVRPDLAQEGQDPAAIRAELGWHTDLPTMLTVGSKRVGNLPDVLRALNHSGLPLQLALIAGGDDELYRQFQDTEWHVPTHVYNFVKDMPSMMHAADCIICKAGGLIVSEALACGLPLLLIDVLPGQEAGNADYVVDGGAAERATDAIAALETVYHWLDRDGALLAQRARNARRLGRPRAAYDVADQAQAAAERGPSAKTGLAILGRPKVIDLLTRHGVLGKRKGAGGKEDWEEADAGV